MQEFQFSFFIGIDNLINSHVSSIPRLNFNGKSAKTKMWKQNENTRRYNFMDHSVYLKSKVNIYLILDVGETFVIINAT